MKAATVLTRCAFTALAIGLAAVSSGCAHLTDIPITCGSPPHERQCLGSITVPEEKVGDFEAAARAAIDAVYTDRFAQDVDDFVKNHAGEENLKAAWAGRKPAEIVEALRRTISGTKVATFGCFTGWWDKTFDGTVANERKSDDDPVEFNRWGLASRTSPEIANSIVHEVAHAIGLRHPHMGGPAPTDAAISACEPPYLLGSLVERIAAGPAWRWSSYHCIYLK